MTKYLILAVAAVLACTAVPAQEVDEAVPTIDLPAVRWPADVAGQLQDAYADPLNGGACVFAKAVPVGRSELPDYEGRTYWFALGIEPFPLDQTKHCEEPGMTGLLLFNYDGGYDKPVTSCMERQTTRGRMMWCIATNQMSRVLGYRLDLGFVGIVAEMRLDETLGYATPWGPLVVRPSAWALCHWRGVCD